MTVARAKLVPPDDSRLSLASVGLGDWRLDDVEPVSVEVSDLLAQAGGGQDVLIYVHGFKQTFETAALDAAHLSDGIKFRGRTMVFSWPSKAGLFDYAYDHESAMWSRDDFERVLHSIVATPGAGRIHIVAHSMGTMLTLEPYANFMRDMVTPLRTGSAPLCSPRLISTWTCFRRRSAASVRSPARSPSSPRRTIAHWRCRDVSLAG
jgi:pimeloyl-ACP methyl ester carboxylesterase